MKNINTSFDRLVEFLRKEGCCYLNIEDRFQSTGDTGHRRLIFSVNSHGRDVTEDIDIFMDEISEATGTKAIKLFSKKTLLADEGGIDSAVVIGNIKGDLSTRWAISMGNFDGYAGYPHYGRMEVKILEDKKDIDILISHHKSNLIIREAEQVVKAITFAARLNPKKLIALREAVGRTKEGKEILRVWDAAAVGETLDIKTPKARGRRVTRL